MELLNQWKHCVVNLELGNDTDDSENRDSCTAIFVYYKERFFLITARHALIDRRIGSHKPVYDQLYTRLYRIPLLDELKDDQKLKIINKSLFYDENGVLNSEYVPEGSSAKCRGEEIAAPNSIQLSESTDPEDCAVTISEDVDLAVISLRIRVSEYLLNLLPKPEPIFAEELVKLGYQPITIDEIGEEPSREGAEIFTVGYPAHVSQIKQREEIVNKYEG